MPSVHILILDVVERSILEKSFINEEVMNLCESTFTDELSLWVRRFQIEKGVDSAEVR